MRAIYLYIFPHYIILQTARKVKYLRENFLLLTNIINYGKILKNIILYYKKLSHFYYNIFCPACQVFVRGHTSGISQLSHGFFLYNILCIKKQAILFLVWQRPVESIAQLISQGRFRTKIFENAAYFPAFSSFPACGEVRGAGRV